MTVLSVAYPLAHVGPDAVGGAEQVLATLDTSLVKAGHHSLVVASADSQVEGELIPLPEVRGAFDSETLLAMHRHCLQAIRAALTRHKVDLVHMHGLDFHAYLPPAGVPVLATLHLPIAWYPPAIFACERPATFLHCVSDAQNRDCPPSPNLLPPIYNGVAIASAAGACNKRYALAIGRICPEKGFHLALDAATLAGVPLLLAGKTFPYEAHESYFRQEVKPRLNGLHAYVGPVGGEAKHKLYAEARCLIVASTVAETSSLVALEALACGTPVVAFRAGALPEIIADGRNGFLVDSIEEMGRAITRSVEIDPEDCRKTVRDRFSIETMTARYMETFRSLCKASSLFRFV